MAKKINKEKRNYYLKLHGRISKETGIPQEVIYTLRSFILGEKWELDNVLEWSQNKLVQPRRKLKHARAYYKQLNAGFHAVTAQQLDQLLYKYPSYEESVNANS